MAGYLAVKKCTNLMGRIDYISNEDRQEDIRSYYSTTGNDFWKKLAKESREQFSRENTKGKCCEARELIIALPQNCGYTADNIAEYFKGIFGVECACAIHHKAEKDNLHAHLIFAERTLLPEPEVVADRVALRSYFYDENGKQCKKADAFKIVPKGSVIRAGHTRLFSAKNDYFATKDFTSEVKTLFLENDLHLAKFDNSRNFATQHIGKNNPKGSYIAEYNQLVNELNDYFALIEDKYDLQGITPKQEFCRFAEIKPKSTFAVPLKDDIRAKFDDFKEIYPPALKTSQNRNESLTEPTKESVPEFTISQEEKNNLLINYSTIQQDLKSYYTKYDCYYDRLRLDKDYSYPCQQFNELIDYYALDIEPIKERSTRANALGVADIIKNKLMALLDYIRDIFKSAHLDVDEELLSFADDYKELNNKEDDWF